MDVISGLTKKSKSKSRRRRRSDGSLGVVNGMNPDLFSSRLMALEHLWTKCITPENNHIEKGEVDLNRK